MVKNPFSSQKFMTVILRFLYSILLICSVLYGIFYFMGAYLELTFGVPVMCLAIMNASEKIKIE